MRMLGDKVHAREIAKKARVPCVPGSEGAMANADVTRAIGDYYEKRLRELTPRWPEARLAANPLPAPAGLLAERDELDGWLDRAATS